MRFFKLTDVEIELYLIFRFLIIFGSIICSSIIGSIICRHGDDMRELHSLVNFHDIIYLFGGR